MTELLDPPTATDPADPSTRVESWLRDFEDALTARDTGRAASLFAPTSFWRDLVSFTWNITTVEDPAGVKTLLDDVLDRVDPSAFTLTEPATEADGVVEAWIAFETGVGRGKGHLRLTDEGAWTLLTS
ncbi:MAG: NAD(P)/FAD-dependent oxidoreductase, partial [Actinomycetales bacterium]